MSMQPESIMVRAHEGWLPFPAVDGGESVLRGTNTGADATAAAREGDAGFEVMEGGLDSISL
jgi:hypothetical protein